MARIAVMVVAGAGKQARRQEDHGSIETGCQSIGIGQSMSKRPRVCPKVRPTQSELDEMLREHLSFEIGRFRSSASMWNKEGIIAPVNQIIKESCLIHLRLLLDFFYPRKNSEKSNFKDVFYYDYLPDKTTLSQELRNLLDEPSWVKKYRNELDWRLAHLTLERFAFKDKPEWNPPFEHMEKLISEFLAALPEKTRSLFNPNRE